MLFTVCNKMQNYVVYLWILECSNQFMMYVLYCSNVVNVMGAVGQASSGAKSHCGVCINNPSLGTEAICPFHDLPTERYICMNLYLFCVNH